MTPAQIEAYVDATSAALGLRLRPDHRSGVLRYFALAAEFAAIVDYCLSRGGASAEMARLLAPQADDRSVLKPRHSAFFGTPLEFLLDELHVGRLVLAGLAADSCIMFTAHDAYLREYALWIPADCVASEQEAWRCDALAYMARVMKARVGISAPLQLAALRSESVHVCLRS